jgi:hypothetical protein
MPNWTSNTLTVSGDKERLLRFRAIAKSEVGEENEGSEFSLDKFIPMPEQYRQDERWYNWSIKNWGCKWDITAGLIQDDEREITYVFDSPWNPPIEAIKRIGKRFKKLSFRLEYEESGLGFSGILIIKDGIVLHDISEDFVAGLCEQCNENSHFNMNGICMLCGEYSRNYDKNLNI